MEEQPHFEQSKALDQSAMSEKQKRSKDKTFQIK